MLTMNINEEDKAIYVNVSGYINKREVNNFLNTYKQRIKNKKTSLYRLIINPENFQCEDDEDIKTVCMTFYKTGYKKIYIVDKDNYIVENLRLKPMEKKLFFKVVKIINSVESAK